MTIGAGYENVAGLRIRPVLRHFVENEVLPGAGQAPATFWPGLAAIIAELMPRYRPLFAARVEFQGKIDEYHRAHCGQPQDVEAYAQFLREIGYLVPAPAADAYEVATKNVDAEMAVNAGPQLVASLSDAAGIRDAVNARWGSLYAALAKGEAGDSTRMAGVVAEVRAFLDRAAPLAGGSHADVAAYMVERDRLEAVLPDGSRRRLKSNCQFAGFTGPRHEPKSILLKNNGLHLELRIDRDHPVGQRDAAGIADVIAEAALSVIMDLDDAIGVSSVEDKVAAYRHWLGLITGGFAGEAAAQDRAFMAPDGAKLVLPDRPILLLRHTAHHIFTDMVLDGEGQPVPEAFIDAAVTVAISLQDIRGPHAGGNSRTGSIYVIKPRIHGPDELSMADLLFKVIEELVGLTKYTMKIGVIDEEARTSLNLQACMGKVRDRTFLLKTTTEERIGDEIRTAMEAGPVPRRAEMRDAAWFHAYEAGNVDTGIARNLLGRAAIGKDGVTGDAKTLLAGAGAGASALSVSTPAEAVVRAMDFHLVDAVSVQEGSRLRTPVAIGDQLAVSVVVRCYTPEEVAAELDGILRELLAVADAVVMHGKRIGARAKLQAGGQHLMNWLRHGLIDDAQLRAAVQHFAAAGQNGPALKAVEKLIFETHGCADALLTA